LTYELCSLTTQAPNLPIDSGDGAVGAAAADVETFSNRDKKRDSPRIQNEGVRKLAETSTHLHTRTHKDADTVHIATLTEATIGKRECTTRTAGFIERCLHRYCLSVSQLGIKRYASAATVISAPVDSIIGRRTTASLVIADHRRRHRLQSATMHHTDVSPSSRLHDCCCCRCCCCTRCASHDSLPQRRCISTTYVV
jgi:hypothetical protein